MSTDMPQIVRVRTDRESQQHNVAKLVATGMVYIHSAQPVLVPHIQWALSSALGYQVECDWIKQPAEPGSLRAEYSWTGQHGTATKIAGALRGWDIRFEVTEDTCGATTGERYSYTPSLGVFHALTGVHGDILISENQLRAALEKDLNDDAPIRIELATLLGQPWDDELEIFRYAGEGTPVSWLHAVM